MSDVEKYKKLKGERESLLSRLNSLPGEIDRIKAGLGPLQDAAVRAEIMGDRNALNRRAEIDQAKRKQADLESERQDLKHRTTIMQEVLGEYRVAANSELVREFEPRILAAKRALIEAIRAAYADEIAMRKLFMEGHAASQEIDVLNPVPTWSPEFIVDLTRDDLAPRWRNFIDRQAM